LEEIGGYSNRDKAIIKEEQIIDIFSGIGKFLFADICGNKSLAYSADLSFYTGSSASAGTRILHFGYALPKLVQVSESPRLTQISNYHRRDV